MTDMVEPLLYTYNLSVSFETDEGLLPAVRDAAMYIHAGETVAVVGESGAGKSQLFHALLGLQAKNARVSGDAVFAGTSLLDLKAKALNRIRGAEISMIFQDPMTALNPYLRIGKQLCEVLQVHRGMSFAQAKKRSLEMLAKVQLDDPERVFSVYPHQLSGGMRQRVMIAMSLLCEPRLIIADEPTTALDVTTQSDIIRLLSAIHREQGTSMVLITHDLPLVAGLCERVVIMYAGKIVETLAVEDLHEQARHPYTQALLASVPDMSGGEQALQGIQGQPPNPLDLPTGCAFAPRCDRVTAECLEAEPALDPFFVLHHVACFNAGEWP